MIIQDRLLHKMLHDLILIFVIRQTHFIEYGASYPAVTKWLFFIVRAEISTFL